MPLPPNLVVKKMLLTPKRAPPRTKPCAHDKTGASILTTAIFSTLCCKEPIAWFPLPSPSNRETAELHAHSEKGAYEPLKGLLALPSLWQNAKLFGASEMRGESGGCRHSLSCRALRAASTCQVPLQQRSREPTHLLLGLLHAQALGQGGAAGLGSGLQTRAEAWTGRGGVRVGRVASEGSGVGTYSCRACCHTECEEWGHAFEALPGERELFSLKQSSPPLLQSPSLPCPLHHPPPLHTSRCFSILCLPAASAAMPAASSSCFGKAHAPPLGLLGPGR